MPYRRFVAILVAAVIVAPPTGGLAAECQASKYFDLPVTMVAQNPIVTAQINGRDARFILDSGAFFSTIAKATALDYGLSVGEVAPGARLTGIGGETSLGVATAKTFGIAGQTLPHLQFAVGGSDTGYAGLLGQNILAFADTEYDLPHGMVRMMKSHGCAKVGMAYWAGTKPYAMIEVEPLQPGQRHTIGTIRLNGVKVKATFDTGADRSMLTLAAAKRIGITPDSAGVTPDGFAYGLGQGRVRTWRARFESIDLGGERVPRPWLTIADQSLAGADMLIGIDFFLSHRLYVDNANHRMFVTYEGGPVFGLHPGRAVDGAGVALDLTDHAGEPTDAAGYSRRGALLAVDHRFDAAIADFDRAVALAPGDARYLLQRAVAHLENRQPLLGAADLDRAVDLAPGDAEIRLVRAQLRLGAHDPAGALADLHAADTALPPPADARLRLAQLYDAADAPEPALASFDLWLHGHPEDHGRPSALNGRCWARALLNRDLDKALADCDAALRLRPNEAAFLDSRALVRLRRGDLDRALADYNAAIAVKPRSAWSLYARGVAERRRGDAAAADADRAAATAIDPRVAERAKRYHLEE